MGEATGQLSRTIVLTRRPDSYSCVRFMAAAEQLALPCGLVDPHSIQLQLESNRTDAVDVYGKSYTNACVIPRLGSLASEFSMAVLRQLELSGATALNSYESLMRLRFKFSALSELATAGVGVPDTEMLRAPADAGAAVERLGGYPVVLKFLRGNQGVGVVYAPDESVVQSVLEAMNLVQYDVMLQRFYPQAALSDIRVLTLNGKARWAVRRTSSDGRFRSNFHRGGTAEAIELTAELAGLAEQATAVFGLGFAGVDIVEGDHGLLVLEVNGSPGFETVDTAHGVDVAAEVMQLLTGN